MLGPFGKSLLEDDALVMPPLLRIEIELQRDLNLIPLEEIGVEVGDVPGGCTLANIVKFYMLLNYKPLT